MFSLRQVVRLVPVLVNDLVLRMRDLLSQLLRFLLIMCELALQFLIVVCRVLHGRGLVRALPNEIGGLTCVFSNACFELTDAAAGAGQLHG